MMRADVTSVELRLTALETSSLGDEVVDERAAGRVVEGVGQAEDAGEDVHPGRRWRESVRTMHAEGEGGQQHHRAS